MQMQVPLFSSAIREERDGGSESAYGALLLMRNSQRLSALEVKAVDHD